MPLNGLKVKKWVMTYKYGISTIDRLFTSHPMASFSCQILNVLCLVRRVDSYFAIEPKNSKKQIRPGKDGNIIFICP